MSHTYASKPPSTQAADSTRRSLPPRAVQLQPTLQRKCACGRYANRGAECIQCQEARRPTLQRNAAGATAPETVPPIVQEVLRSPGQPLDAATRAFMEPRFGGYFGGVRVHVDTKAAASARAVDAQAYTIGQDIVFGQGRYSPNSDAGRRLLAHELAHVVQQHQASPANIRLVGQTATASQELEANHVADAVVSRERPQAPAVQTYNANFLLRQNDRPSDKSRQSRPRDAPRGTRPIDQTDLDREDIHKIKDGIGAGPRDWVGVTPEGEVISSDHEGNAINHGPTHNYLRESHPEIPNWLWPLLGIAAAAALIACFATGVCEIGAVIYGLGSATAALVIALLRSAGIRDSGAGAAAEQQGEPESTLV